MVSKPPGNMIPRSFAETLHVRV